MQAERQQLKVTAGAGYFEMAGQPFLVQGCSVPRIEHVTRDSLTRVASRGLRVLRVWPDYEEVGRLDLDALRNLRSWAEALDLRIFAVLFSPGCLSDLFDGHSNFHLGRTAYNSFCQNPADAVTRSRAETLAVLQQRFDQLLDVFEDSPVLASWEVVNETDPLYDVPSAEMADFIDRLADMVRLGDARHGTNRLVTATSFQPFPPKWLLSREALDFIGFHPYAGSIHQPTDRIEGAIHVGNAITFALHSETRGRPVLDTESGVIANLFDPGVPRPDRGFRAELAHNLRWAHFAAGGAGTGLHVSINDDGLRAERRVPLNRLRWEPVDEELADMWHISAFSSLARGSGPVRSLSEDLQVGSPGVFGFSSATPSRVVGWLLRDTRSADLAADIERALAAGPTVAANIDLRLQSLDSWRAGLRRHSLDPLNRFTREAISLLLRRGPTGSRRACKLIDEGMEHLLGITKLTEPRVLSPVDACAGRARIRVRNVPNAPLLLTWLDDVSGTVVESSQHLGPEIDAESPSFTRHLAFIITPLSMQSPDNGWREPSGPHRRSRNGPNWA